MYYPPNEDYPLISNQSLTEYRRVRYRVTINPKVYNDQYKDETSISIISLMKSIDTKGT